MSSLAAVVLCAGKGTRMKSERAKLLHPLLGRPLVTYPFAQALGLGASPLVAVVGHQPGLGALLTACLLGEDGALPIEFKKNAVACVSFEGRPRAGRGALAWLATPRMLRGLRGS